MEALQEHLRMSSINSSNVIGNFVCRQNVTQNDETESDEEIDIEDVDNGPTKMIILQCQGPSMLVNILKGREYKNLILMTMRLLKGKV